MATNDCVSISYIFQFLRNAKEDQRKVWLLYITAHTKNTGKLTQFSNFDTYMSHSAKLFFSRIEECQLIKFDVCIEHSNHSYFPSKKKP